jgi:predicted ester cyclase
VSEANKAILRRFVAEWLNEEDAEAMMEVCDPHIAFHWGALGEGRGVRRLQQLERGVRGAFPDLTVTTEFVLAEGDLVMQRSTVTGTHLGPWFGVPPTGKRATWTAMEVYRVAGGKIVEQWLNEDWTSVLQQLGALPHT